MRDLHRDGRTSPNGGAASVVDTALPTEPIVDPEPDTESRETVAGPQPTLIRLAAQLAPYVAEYLLSAREKKLARMAVTMIETARLLEPITRIAVARTLSIGSLVAAVADTVWTGYLIARGATPWPLVATLGVALAFLLPIIWRGQPKAPPEPSR